MKTTYHYNAKLKKMVEGPAPRNCSTPLVSDAFYADKPFKAHDGTVIDSRKKHREYMKRHNLTTLDDFSGVLERKKQERESHYTGTNKRWREETKRDIARAIDQTTRRK